MEYLAIRLTCSFLVGVIISQTGSFIQLSTRNILASPSTLGMDGLSILWILVLHSLLLFFNLELPTYLSAGIGIPLFVGVGLFMTRFLKVNNHFEKVIFLGITFNLLVGAIFSLWQFLFLAFNLPFPVEVWFGHFRFSEFESLLLVGIVELALLLGVYSFRKDLKLFSLGPDIYRNWKLNETSLFRFLFISVALGTYTVVGLFGAFSFLGLIFPILARKIWFQKFDLKGEILFGSLLNGFLLMMIDGFCYYFTFMGAEIPVGLIATFVGALSLIIILWIHNSGEFLAKSKK